MSIRPGTNFTTDDLDYIGRPREERYDSWGTAEILTEYKECISVGQPMDGISELGHLYRQLLQESDFHASGRTLLKKIKPEEDERWFNGFNLPKELKKVLLTLEEEEIGTSTLKNVISLVIREEDRKALLWITNNWEVFLETKPGDALANAEFQLSEEEVIKDTENEPAIQKKEKIKGGYTKDSYSVVEVFRKSFFKEAAERRLSHLKARLRDIQICNSPEEIEKVLWRIREAYEEDREILDAWSPARKKEDRKLYLESLHKRGLDFEVIRRKMWFCFDRELEEKVEVLKSHPCRANWVEHYDPKTGKVKKTGLLTQEEIEEILARKKPDPREPISSKFTIPPALWEIQKSKSFCELNQTRAQWNKIYNYLWQRVSETIVWQLQTMRQYEQGIELCKYIRRYQFRLNSEKLGKAILDKAKKIQTERGKYLIKMLLANYQYQLPEPLIKQIAQEINRRKI